MSEKENANEIEEINAIIDGFGDPLFILDEKQIIIRVNRATCDLFHKEPEKILGKHCYEIVHGINHPFPDCPAIKALKTKQVVSGEIEDSNVGIPLLVTASPILDKKGEVTRIVHTAKDISKIRAASVELQIAANLFESASDSILVHDLEGKIFYFNEAAYKTRGFTKEEFQELTILDIESPEDPRFFGEKMNQLLEKGESTFETINLRKDKSVFPVEIHAQVIDSDGEKVVLILARDISERKKNEAIVRESNCKIEVMNEKLRVIGSLTRHDVRNKLSAVTGYAYLLKKKHCDLPDVVDGLSKVELAVRQSVKIFDFAKMYEQLGLEELSYVDVDAKFEDACALITESIPQVINECRGLHILADSFLLQLFYNLLDNTRKYGKKTKTIRVHYEISENLKLIYEDDGAGILFENKKYLFREGYSTGGSTGYGLFLISKMMDIYGWTIHELGEPGNGVKFVITIPALNRKNQLNYKIL